ncbi:MAG: hypothetical protein ISR65_05835 [Bacteriovoracaceae bacterium]|nr:hypothetical protein [Bacteriovoracaceae bacterium]
MKNTILILAILLSTSAAVCADSSSFTVSGSLTSQMALGEEVDSYSSVIVDDNNNEYLILDNTSNYYYCEEGLYRIAKATNYSYVIIDVEYCSR